MRSSSRPGQAMSTSTPAASACTCGFWPTPPKTTVDRMPSARARGSTTAFTWLASSRVGTRTSARGRLGCRLLVEAASRATSGMLKARVLPEPVRPRPSTSRPARVSGSVATWIGNGAVMPLASSTSTSGAGTPSASKVVSVGSTVGAASPAGRTGATGTVSSARVTGCWPAGRGPVPRPRPPRRRRPSVSAEGPVAVCEEAVDAVGVAAGRVARRRGRSAPSEWAGVYWLEVIRRPQQSGGSRSSAGRGAAVVGPLRFSGSDVGSPARLGGAASRRRRVHLLSDERGAAPVIATLPDAPWSPGRGGGVPRHIEVGAPVGRAIGAGTCGGPPSELGGPPVMRCGCLLQSEVGVHVDLVTGGRGVLLGGDGDLQGVAHPVEPVLAPDDLPGLEGRRVEVDRSDDGAVQGDLGDAAVGAHRRDERDARAGQRGRVLRGRVGRARLLHGPAERAGLVHAAPTAGEAEPAGVVRRRHREARSRRGRSEGAGRVLRQHLEPVGGHRGLVRRARDERDGGTGLGARGRRGEARDVDERAAVGALLQLVR